MGGLLGGPRVGRRSGQWRRGHSQRDDDVSGPDRFLEAALTRTQILRTKERTKERLWAVSPSPCRKLPLITDCDSRAGRRSSPEPVAASAGRLPSFTDAKVHGS